MSRSTAPFEECPGTSLLSCTMTEMGHHRIGQWRGGGILMKTVQTKGELCGPKAPA